MKRILYLIIAVIAVAVSCQKTDEMGTLPVPANFTAALDGTTITLDWDAVAEASSYIVYWNIEGEQSFSKSDLLPEPGYVLEKARTGYTYEFKARAANNVAVSEFTEVVKVFVPKSDVSIAEMPEISNVRPGLGWVNFTMTAYTGDCTYEVYDGDTKVETAFMEKMGDGTEPGTEEYSLGGLELNRKYTDLKIKRLVVDFADSDFADFGTFKTGNITVLTRNPSARHIAFEWDDVAGNANWTFNASVDPLTRTYKVEIATDADFTNLVYSLYTVNNWARNKDNRSGTYSVNNWVGQSGTPDAAAKPYAAANTNLSVGQLEPATTYWIRIRNAAGESVDDFIDEGEKIEMNAATGKSVWSKSISATTQPEHTPAAGELLYQPFDDHAIQFDHINCASGASPSMSGDDLINSTTSAYQYPWTGEWGAFAPHSGVRYDNLGVAVVGTFDGNNENELDGLAIYDMDTDRIPSMKGWHCSKACYPQQGALKLGGSAGQKNYIITPAFKDVADGTAVTISCDAGAAHAASTPAKLHIKVYRAATHALELVKTFDLPASATILNPNGTGGFHNIVDMQPWSVDAILNKGDYVMFEAETIKTPATNRLVIDNILIKMK